MMPMLLRKCMNSMNSWRINTLGNPVWGSGRFRAHRVLRVLRVLREKGQAR